MKKVLKVVFISSCAVVVLVVVIGIGVYIFYFTAAPVYIANKVLPPPNLAKKNPQERKKIVLKFLNESGVSWDFSLRRAFEVEIRMLRMGKPFIHTLIDIIKDEKLKEGLRYLARDMLERILQTQLIPLEEKLQEPMIEQRWPARDVRILQSYFERFYYYANKMIDTKELTNEMISILLSDEDAQAKAYIKPCAVLLLKKTRDRRLAAVLEEGGRDYRVWVWTDEAGRKKAIRIAMDVLQGKYNPGLPAAQEELIRKYFSEEEKAERERRIIYYAIETLGEARAVEAVSLLGEMFDVVERKGMHQQSLLEALGKIGTDEAIEILMKRYPEGGGWPGCIRVLGESKNKKAIPFLEKLLKNNDHAEEAAEALKKLRGNYGEKG